MRTCILAYLQENEHEVRCADDGVDSDGTSSYRLSAGIERQACGGECRADARTRTTLYLAEQKRKQRAPVRRTRLREYDVMCSDECSYQSRKVRATEELSQSWHSYRASMTFPKAVCTTVRLSIHTTNYHLNLLVSTWRRHSSHLPILKPRVQSCSTLIPLRLRHASRPALNKRLSVPVGGTSCIVTPRDSVSKLRCSSSKNNYVVVVSNHCLV
jgi:hypothetical protein